MFKNSGQVRINLFLLPIFPQTCWECRINDERPTGKKNITIEWDDGGKIGNKNKSILTEIVPSVHATWYLKYW